MGGNALKNTETERKSRDEYLYISGYMIGALDRLFPRVQMSLVKAYHTKESFGDLDMLIASDNLPYNWKQMVEEEFKPNEIFNNGNVMSFDYMKMQIDLITVPARELRMASTYFAFNDLGNLMGRIAQRMGFKYGSNGLWKGLKDSNDQRFAEILVSQEPEAIFAFLGYNWERFKEGFETLEDIFEYAASTPFFNSNVYLLEHRNNYSRTRDAKRPTYTAFLKWLENKPELNVYPWDASLDLPPAAVVAQAVFNRDHPHQVQKREMTKRAEDMFPDFTGRVTEAMEEHARVQAVKRSFNGAIAGELTGYKGRLLGMFLAFCRDQYDDFDDYILNNPDVVKEMIVLQKARFEQQEQERNA